MTRPIDSSNVASPPVPGRPNARPLGRPPRTTGLPFALFSTLCLLAACTAAPGGSPAATPETPTPSTGTARSLQPSSTQPSQDPIASPGPLGLPASVVDPIVADIAGLAGVPVDGVTVLSAEAVTFPDGGLGCPVPGMSYPQVQVDGYKVVAVAGGTTYDYRGTAPGTFRRCTPRT